jgi:transcription-repair coupling factor (superfamily II helicase)
MFQDSADHHPPSGDANSSDLRLRSHAALGPTLARLCRAVAQGSVITVVGGEQRAEALFRAAAAMCSARVLWLPPADALPGEGTRSSAAIAGRRVAALSALHNPDQQPFLLVTDASAAAQKVAPPAAFATEPTVVAPGDDLDGEALAAELEAIGYFGDERVDEPGEFAIRSGAIDIFPADADAPARIHLNGGRVERIALYDAVTQLGIGDELERLVIRAAAEPPMGADALTIFEHLPGAAVALDPEAEERRDRFIEIAEDGPAGAPRQKLVEAEEWKAGLAGRRRIDLSADGEQPGRRFVEARNPEKLLLAALKEARARGDRVVIAGSARDLRFFSRRIEQRLKDAPRQVSGWDEVEGAQPGALLAAEVDLDRGWSEPGLTVIATADALGARAQQASIGASSNPLLQDVIDFHLGDAVIHEDHGLGVLRGVETVITMGMESEAIRIEYAGGGQRLVPVEEADRIWRYGAEADAVSLDKPDGKSW